MNETLKVQEVWQPPSRTPSWHAPVCPASVDLHAVEPACEGHFTLVDAPLIQLLTTMAAKQGEVSCSQTACRPRDTHRQLQSHESRMSDLLLTAPS